ncbi:MCM7 [Symbiodinium sp. CCMP2592]|nr:MCM7 [Symbiodinium sp. CCMP2592]
MAFLLPPPRHPPPTRAHPSRTHPSCARAAPPQPTRHPNPPPQPATPTRHPNPPPPLHPPSTRAHPSRTHPSCARAAPPPPAEATLREPATAATATQSTQASEGRKKGKQRQTASRAVVHLSHCSICGSCDHRAPTCPQRTAPSDADQRKAKDAALEKNRRKARLVARLKYTALHQRSTDYINKSRQRSRATLSRDFLTFARMSPMELALALIEDGLLQNLEGTSCTNPKCGEQKGFGGESTLGPLRQGQKNEPNMTRRAVHYRCQCCRKRVTVSAGNPLFVGSGAGQHSMSLTILAFWNCVEGISITHTVHQLAVDEKVVSRLFGCAYKNDYMWYRTARQIMVWDILRLQDAMIFGKGSETIDVEADESQFQSWSIVNDSSGARTYYWHVWLGVIQRGNPSNFYLESLGVTVSHGEPRVPPLTAAAWRKTCEKVFDEDANVVLMTDSAQAYASVDVPGIVEKHTVNHSEHEFSRSVSVLQNVSTRERRPGMAGTQLVDREWGHLKDLLPHSLSARTEEERARYAEYIREAQWKRVLHTSDRWQRFCVAARDYMQADSRAVVVYTGSLSVLTDRYFESQEAGRCGMHALNNCLGQQVFAAEDLETVAVAVVEETGRTQCTVAPGGQQPQPSRPWGPSVRLHGGGSNHNQNGHGAPVYGCTLLLSSSSSLLLFLSFWGCYTLQNSTLNPKPYYLLLRPWCVSLMDWG